MIYTKPQGNDPLVERIALLKRVISDPTTSADDAKAAREVLDHMLPHRAVPSSEARAVELRAEALAKAQAKIERALIKAQTMGLKDAEKSLEKVQAQITKNIGRAEARADKIQARAAAKALKLQTSATDTAAKASTKASTKAEKEATRAAKKADKERDKAAKKAAKALGKVKPTFAAAPPPSSKYVGRMFDFTSLRSAKPRGDYFCGDACKESYRTARAAGVPEGPFKIGDKYVNSYDFHAAQGTCRNCDAAIGSAPVFTGPRAPTGGIVSNRDVPKMYFRAIPEDAKVFRDGERYVVMTSKGYRTEAYWNPGEEARAAMRLDDMVARTKSEFERKRRFKGRKPGRR